MVWIAATYLWKERWDEAFERHLPERAKVPERCLCVELAGLYATLDEPYTNSEGAVFRVDRFSTVQDFLDCLYTNYLAHKYPPFSYGEKWILMTSRTLFNQVLLHWSLACSAENGRSLAKSWAHSGLQDKELTPGSHWFVAPVPRGRHVIASDRDDMWRTVEENLKSITRLLHSELFDKLPASAVGFCESTETTVVCPVRGSQCDWIAGVFGEAEREGRQNFAFVQRVDRLPREWNWWRS